MSEKHPLRYFLQVGEAVAEVREIDGREAVSAPFRFEVRFTLEEGLWAEPEELLKRPASIRMERDGEHVRSVAGIVTEIACEAKVRGVTEVFAAIEPHLSLLRHRTDHRVFRDKSVPEIVEEVLRVIGIVPNATEAPSRLALRLSGSYAKRAYTVQSSEADLDFVHRLLEDEGIHYYFLEHDGLVLGDSPAAYEPISGPPVVPFRAGHGMDGNQDAINAIGRRAAASVGRVSLSDLNLDKPSLDLSAGADGPTPGGPELYDYPGEYAEPAEGARKARIIADAYACEAATFSGTSLSGRLAPGHVFELEDTPDGVADGRHLVTVVRHAWKRDATAFSCGFDSLPAETTYRPPVVTPEPRLVNPVSGVVTGPAGEDIHTDSAGRVKVHFHWDRQKPYDDDCSDWIPVIQDNTGHSVAIPRIGWEVLVHFLEGDPDRPVVLGRLYNAEDNFPNPLPAQKTKSALKSLSSPGRNGTNQIELDDLAGSEKVTVLAEKDQNIRVANDKDTLIQNDQEVVVTRDEKVDIGHDQTVKVGNDFNHSIERSQTRCVEGSRTRKVSGSETSTIEKDRTLTIGSTHMRRIGTDDIVNANDLVEKVSAVNLEAFIKTNTTGSSRTGRLTVGGALLELVKDQKSESAKVRAETVGGMFFTKTGKGQTTTVQRSRVVTVGGAKTITGQEGVTIASPVNVSFSALSGSFEASDLTLKVGGSFVQMKDGTLVIHAAKTLTFSITGQNKIEAGGIAIIPASEASLSAADAGYATSAASASGGGATGASAVKVSASFDASGAILGPDPKGAANPAEADKAAGADGAQFERAHLDDSQIEQMLTDLQERTITKGDAEDILRYLAKEAKTNPEGGTLSRWGAIARATEELSPESSLNDITCFLRRMKYSNDDLFSIAGLHLREGIPPKWSPELAALEDDMGVLKAWAEVPTNTPGHPDSKIDIQHTFVAIEAGTVPAEPWTLQWVQNGHPFLFTWGGDLMSQAATALGFKDAGNLNMRDVIGNNVGIEMNSEIARVHAKTGEYPRLSKLLFDLDSRFKNPPPPDDLPPGP